jgi:NAD-dependent deacetylase
MLRPAVVWFGEALPEAALREAMLAAQAADVFLVVGTSSVVYPAAALPRLALEHGARVIEVNPESTELSPHASLFLRGNAGDVLPRIV